MSHSTHAYSNLCLLAYFLWFLLNNLVFLNKNKIYFLNDLKVYDNLNFFNTN